MRSWGLARANLGGLASSSGFGHAFLHLSHAPVFGARASNRPRSRWGFPPQCARSAFRLATGSCSSCFSRMWFYGLLKPNKSKLFVLGETNRVVLVRSCLLLINISSGSVFHFEKHDQQRFNRFAAIAKVLAHTHAQASSNVLIFYRMIFFEVSVVQDVI